MAEYFKQCAISKCLEGECLRQQLMNLRKLFFILVFWGFTLCLSASDPVSTVLAVEAAKKGSSGIVRAGKGIAEVPYQVGECIRLPMGIVEMVLSPLPGITFKDGLEDTGQGILAPFRLCRAILKMPVEVVGGFGEAVF